MTTTTDRKPRVLISGGGTGGHIFPALSIAAAIRRRHPQAEILFVGAEGRMEMERVPAAGYEIIGLPVAGFDRRHLLRNFKVLVQLFKSMKRARSIIRDFKPDLVVGVGGYASGPTLKAAQRAGIPTLLQEQNSYAGVTNKLLAKRAGKICTAYDHMDRFFPAESIVKTGNPVRAALTCCTLSPGEAKAQLGLDPSKPLLLVVGGSLGARSINSAMISGALDSARADSPAKSGFQVLWQTGRSDSQRCSAAARQANAPGVTVTEFISDMAMAYRAADLVVARAGAGTISELQVLGLPVVLVPSPNVAEDHQRKNALALVEQDAAVMVEDAKAADELWPAVTALMNDKERREVLKTNISRMALRNSDELIADEADRLMGLKN